MKYIVLVICMYVCERERERDSLCYIFPLLVRLEPEKSKGNCANPLSFVCLFELPDPGSISSPDSSRYAHSVGVMVARIKVLFI